MHKKQNNKETKTYVQGLRPFGNVLPRGLRGVLKKNGYNYSEIIGKWNMLVGKDISSCSYPKSIKMKKGNLGGKLVLAIKRGNEIDIEYSKEKIINKINSYFGYKLINEIKIEQMNTETKNTKNKYPLKFDFPNLEKKINDVKNKNIKKSLSQLMKTIKND